MARQLPDYLVHISDGTGTLIYSNVPQECRRCVEAPPSAETETTTTCALGKKRRRGMASNTDGTVYVCTNDPDAVKSAKIFKREISFYLTALQKIGHIRNDIAKQEAAKARRLLHNLISLNAHSLFDLYSVVSQDDLNTFSRQNFRTQKEMIRQRLAQNPDAGADLFIRTLRNEAAVKNELAVFKRLYDGNAVAIHKKPHAVHKVVVNVANYFFQEFADKRVRLIVEKCDDLITMDYESMQVALYHLLDNAAKYCAPDSSLRIHFSYGANTYCILLDMVSHYLRPEERKSIFEEGFSGSAAKSTNLAGQGLGMGTVRDLLALNSAELDAKWGEARFKSKDSGAHYADNTLVVRFKL